VKRQEFSGNPAKAGSGFPIKTLGNDIENSGFDQINRSFYNYLIREDVRVAARGLMPKWKLARIFGYDPDVANDD